MTLRLRVDERACGVLCTPCTQWLIVAAINWLDRTPLKHYTGPEWDAFFHSCILLLCIWLIFKLLCKLTERRLEWYAIQWQIKCIKILTSRRLFSLRTWPNALGSHESQVNVCIFLLNTSNGWHSSHLEYLSCVNSRLQCHCLVYRQYSFLWPSLELFFYSQSFGFLVRAVLEIVEHIINVIKWLLSQRLKCPIQNIWNRVTSGVWHKKMSNQCCTSAWGIDGEVKQWKKMVNELTFLEINIKMVKTVLGQNHMSI